MQAGLAALRAGGNAFDAAIAAQLAACVCEPTLTGMGGGGLAMLRFADGRREVLDCFSDLPGRGLSRAPEPMREALVDFGSDTQVFLWGQGSVAVPGMAPALLELHEAHARLPWSTLAAPALALARGDVAVSLGLRRSIDVCWPILKQDPAMAVWFGQPQGDGRRPAREGWTYRLDAFAGTLARIAQEGPGFLVDGDGAEAMLAALPAGRITEADLAEYRVIRRPALEAEFKGWRVSVPSGPSQAGPLVLKALASLEGAPSDPAGADHTLRVAAALAAADGARDADFQRRILDGEFVRRWLGSGFTTHLGAVDSDGNACSITSSLGETAGVVVPETGVILNNFLGEADVNPPLGKEPGERLLTMCCPTLLEDEAGFYTLGSGGSSRIRSALLQGILGVAEHQLPIADAIHLPRCHFEGGVLRVEAVDRPDGYLEALRPFAPELLVFDERALFFGGLHVAGWRLGPVGGGDGRRSGAFGRV